MIGEYPTPRHLVLEEVRNHPKANNAYEEIKHKEETTPEQTPLRHTLILFEHSLHLIPLGVSTINEDNKGCKHQYCHKPRFEVTSPLNRYIFEDNPRCIILKYIDYTQQVVNQ